MRLLFLTLLFMLSACSTETDELASLASQQYNKSNELETWLNDGTLHFATGLEWQKASFQNKRATLSDYLRALHKQGMLTFDIASNDTLIPYCDILVKQLNEHFEMIGPAVENIKKFENTSVSDAVVKLASRNGWLKKV